MWGVNSPDSKIGTWLREPLLHFMVAGMFIFLVSYWRGGGVDADSRTIMITQERVARLSASWEQIWRRAPTQSEIDGLIRDHIKEEIYYREAKRLGLDEDDTVIRRRLRSKMEFLATAQSENANVDEATLQRWLDRFPARFATDAEISFDQIYLGENGQIASAAILKNIAAGGDWRKLGKAISLPQSLEGATRSDIAREFGDPFTTALTNTPQGEWTGPVQSGFGSHLIRVRSIRSSAKPSLGKVRQAVENDWRVHTAKERENKAYQTLLDGYTIKIAAP
ncbi:peptidyl-prolyl cis-trans isomerase [Sphingorhabdus sp.]|uniref:peptidyl-prolyl cis-trans isomerase n=1 Tax=Sphingorhabdus sp. TaxID=1902408 RepID=UPI0035942940